MIKSTKKKIKSSQHNGGGFLNLFRRKKIQDKKSSIKKQTIKKPTKKQSIKKTSLKKPIISQQK
jgi:hypothetical protein